MIKDFNEARHIRVYADYQNPEVIRISKDGRTWYLVTTDDDEVVEKFPLDLRLAITQYTDWMKGFLWSDLVYHAEDNLVLNDSDIRKHFYRCTTYLEKDIAKRLQEIFPWCECSNERY